MINISGTLAALAQNFQLHFKTIYGAEIINNEEAKMNNDKMKMFQFR